MDKSVISHDEQLFKDFQLSWPVENLEKMSLAQYSTAGDENCFVYRVEFKLHSQGSIKGRSSFKLGIYNRKDKSVKSSGRGRSYTDDYAWLTKYGEDEKTAFETIRSRVVEVARAAQGSNLDLIEGVNLDPIYKWKLAFHYQPLHTPHLINVFVKDPLLHFLGEADTKLTMAELQKRVLSKKPQDKTIFDFSNEIYNQWLKDKAGNVLHITLTQGAITNGYIHFKLVDSIFPEEVYGGKNEAEEAEKVLFETDVGSNYSSDIRVDKKTGRIRSRFGAYFKEVGVKAGDTITITKVGDYEYKIQSNREVSVQMTSKNNNDGLTNISLGLNTILYGPPGTGKTFETAKHAVQICTGSVPADRAEVMAQYNQLKEAEQIVFVTFHQSFSYEEFVEGIRPEVLDDGKSTVTYDIKDGVFKRISDLAQQSAKVKSSVDIKSIQDQKLFKMSLGNSLDRNDDGIYLDCIKNNYILLGYGDGLDYSGCDTLSDVAAKFREVQPEAANQNYSITSVHYLKNVMQIGSLVIISDGNTKFRAIGQISGNYQLVERDDNYVQMRPVKWLATFEESLPIETIFSKRLSQMTIYAPDQSAIKWSAFEALLAPEKKNYVLIIDEINRANISKVFGELITLLEEDKRVGNENIEGLSVSLPYSGKKFSVPDNLFVVGTMNTADRSIALLDSALRRRFEFIEMAPKPELLKDVEGVDINKLLRAINERVEYFYDRDHLIGHAYFMSTQSLADLDRVFRKKVLPLLQEYFYDDWSRVKLILNDKNGEFLSEKVLSIDSDGENRIIYHVNPIAFSANAFKSIYQ